MIKFDYFVKGVNLIFGLCFKGLDQKDMFLSVGEIEFMLETYDFGFRIMFDG